jgi:hypothetical protein
MRITYCFLAGRHGQLGESIHPADKFTVDVFIRIKIFYFGGEFRGVRTGIKQGDIVNTPPAVYQGIPGSDCIQSHRADNTDTGNNNSMIIIARDHCFLHVKGNNLLRNLLSV